MRQSHLHMDKCMDILIGIEDKEGDNAGGVAIGYKGIIQIRALHPEVPQQFE